MLNEDYSYEKSLKAEFGQQGLDGGASPEQINITPWEIAEN